MVLENFTTTFMEQMNNTDCSYLMGMQIGQLYFIRLVIIVFAINFLYNLLSKGLSLAYNYLMKKYKLKTQKPGNPKDCRDLDDSPKE